MPDSQAHDMGRELAGLSSCLAQAKRPLGFLMGAGCALAVRIIGESGENVPLIPDVAGLTRQVATNCASSELATPFAALTDGLRLDLSREPNVEDLLSRLRVLKEIAGTESVRGLTKSQIDRLETAIVGEVTTAVRVALPIGQSPYRDLAVWLGATDRRPAPEIFTTNYDLLVEHALERHHLPYFDGFVGGESPFLDLRAIEEDEIPARWTRLWKLHGAINWTLTAGGEVLRRHAGDGDGQSLIHPSHLKYDQSRRMPYLIMQDRLRGFLRQPGVAIVVVGYSFGDEHINALLVDGLRSNRTASAFALQFASLQTQTKLVELASVIPNLSVLAPDGAVVSTVHGSWKAEADEDHPAFDLGDFSRFGTFLRMLVGEARGTAAEELSNVE